MEIRQERDCFIAITINGVSEEIETSQLIGLIAASVGPENWESDLRVAHRDLSHWLSGQNFGDVGSDAYDPNNPQRGLDMEDLASNIYRKLAGMEPAKPRIPGSKP